MLKNFWFEWTAWWATVTPEFAFLLALPFAVVAVAFVGDFVRARRRGRGVRT